MEPDFFLSFDVKQDAISRRFPPVMSLIFIDMTCFLLSVIPGQQEVHSDRGLRVPRSAHGGAPAGERIHGECV